MGWPAVLPSIPMGGVNRVTGLLSQRTPVRPPFRVTLTFESRRPARSLLHHRLIETVSTDRHEGNPFALVVAGDALRARVQRQLAVH